MKTTKQRLQHYRAMAAKYPGRDWRYWKDSRTFAAPQYVDSPGRAAQR